jgi:hypothetical protein
VPVEVISLSLYIEVLEPLSVFTGGVVVGGGKLWGLIVGEGGAVWLREAVDRVVGSILSGMDVLSPVFFFAWHGVDFPVVNLIVHVVDGTGIIVVIILLIAI